MKRRIPTLRISQLATMLLIGSIVSGQNTLADISTGLQAHYRLDGNALDSSPNGLNGSLNGAMPTADRAGRTGKATLFDGTNDFISINDLSKESTPVPVNDGERSAAQFFERGGHLTLRPRSELSILSDDYTIAGPAHDPQV